MIIGFVFTFIAFVFFFIAGSVFLFLGFRNLSASKTKIKNWTTARGKIMEIRTYRNWGGRKIYTPLVHFNTVQRQQFYFNGHGSQLPHYSAGQDVEVLYNPNNPPQAKIKRDSGNTFTRTIWFLVAGLGFMAALMNLMFAIVSLVSYLG